jgi:hypothetical protein
MPENFEKEILKTRHYWEVLGLNGTKMLEMDLKENRNEILY